MSRIYPNINQSFQWKMFERLGLYFQAREALITLILPLTRTLQKKQPDSPHCREIHGAGAKNGPINTISLMFELPIQSRRTYFLTLIAFLVAFVTEAVYFPEITEMFSVLIFCTSSNVSARLRLSTITSCKLELQYVLSHKFHTNTFQHELKRNEL